MICQLKIQKYRYIEIKMGFCDKTKFWALHVICLDYKY